MLSGHKEQSDGYTQPLPSPFHCGVVASGELQARLLRQLFRKIISLIIAELPPFIRLGLDLLDLRPVLDRSGMFLLVE